MELKIYAIRDVRTEAFLKPMFLQNAAVLERALLDARNDENSTLSMHPQDYQVFKLGTYDDNSGEIWAEEPTFMFNVIEVKEKE
jgi:hypothetical protein